MWTMHAVGHTEHNLYKFVRMIEEPEYTIELSNELLSLDKGIFIKFILEIIYNSNCF